jgi:ATP-dependent DNA helicase RecQ
MKALQDAIARYWGYTTLKPLQREAMDAVLAGRDSVVVLPTGGGKSLCFQAPALVRRGVALVVSPLISLMKDQVDTLVSNGVPAALYNSSLTSDEKAAVVAGLRQVSPAVRLARTVGR